LFRLQGDGLEGDVLTADIDRGPRKATACYRFGTQSHPVAIAASEELDRESDAFLALGLLPAMTLGVPLRVPGEVSPRLLAGARRIQEVARLWIEGGRIVEIEATSGAEPAQTEGRVGAFFSGGVDSFYTVLTSRERITDLIFVHGLDIPLTGNEELRRAALTMAHEVASTLGMHLVEVEADLRSFSDRYVNWRYSNGSALAAVALLLQRRFKEVLIPATMSYTLLYPETPHPLVDPHWSTESLEFQSSGTEAQRIEKIAFLANHELAMRNLRVCYQNREGAYNCGECGKCLRTMISLQVAGALDRCQTLPHDLDLGRVRRMWISNPAQRVFALENLEALRRDGRQPRLARAVRTSLLLSRLRGFGPIDRTLRRARMNRRWKLPSH
jgi:hypothetical protein